MELFPNRLAVVFVGKAHWAAVFHFGVNLGVGCYWFSMPKGRLLSNSDDSGLRNGRHGTAASIQMKHNSPCFLSNSGCLPAGGIITYRLASGIELLLQTNVMCTADCSADTGHKGIS